ncbi:MAG: metallophosphoesterase [Candidatus Thermoplasmatota archaeon]|nr:metallophosphoesterase [Candidatus Thermoplasmatota archaeon]
MNRKRVVALAVCTLVIAASLLVAYRSGLILASDPDMIVDGGIIRAQSEDAVEIWCYKPDVSLRLNGFEGDVRLHNCIAGSSVEGVDEYESLDDTSISFRSTGSSDDIYIRPAAKDSFTFAVLGDSQGRNEVLTSILSELGECEFAILCGDLTPSGMPSEFAAIQEMLDGSPVPIYTTPGNHDAKNDGITEYETRFGPTQYSFDFGGIRFVSVDSSDLDITEEEISWMRGEFNDATRKIIVTHAPCFDPFGDNHTLHPDSCDRMLEFIETDDIEAVFTGHIHAFNHTVIDDTDFIITGGAGATLVDGEYHFVNVTVAGSNSLVFEKVEVAIDASNLPHVTLVGREGLRLNLSYDEMFAMSMTEGCSSFENLYDNIGGAGDYSGVSVANLVELVGGISEGDVLRVTSSDGYLQEFGYLNVCPNEAWLQLQGEMVVALSYESELVPEWEDGPKLVMLAPDGVYSNADCEATSYEGQGYSVYPSAGARWVKCVALVEVIPCP